jgi:ribonuclease D
MPVNALSERARLSPHEPTLQRRVRSDPHLDLPTWRSLVASELHVTPAAVASDDLLWAIADARPGTLADLARIPAVDQPFFEAYGEEILTVLRDGVQVPEWEALGDDPSIAGEGDAFPF